MKTYKIGNPKLPLHFAIPSVALVVLGIGLLEWRSLYNLDHPKPTKVSCIGCHSDKKTLELMADKAGDPLYLVHSGDLSLQELNRLTRKQNVPSTPPIK